MSNSFLLYDLQEGIGTLTLNRPDKHNSLDQALWKDVARALKIVKETSAKIFGEHLYDFWISQLRTLKEISRTEDFQEGAASFLEKRPPLFHGR
jgi:enoyl-CoA hydratase/carnithine racemase